MFWWSGDGSGPHEGNIGQNHVDGKGDVNDDVYEDDIGKNTDLLNEKDNEDDEQGNGSGLNKEEAMNLNFVVENVTKSVDLIDNQEDVSFSQFICDPVVESFLKTLDQGTENVVDGCINQKRVEDDVNENLTGFEKNEFDDRTINLGEDDKVIVAKKDGECEDVEVDLDLGKPREDFSNKNKDGETVEDGLEIIQLKDSKETQSLKMYKVEGKVEKFFVPSFSIGFSQDSEDDAYFDDKYGVVFKPLYLKEINHVKANEMADKNLTPVRLIMPWRTVYNKVDCGIFARRHMESYFREKSYKWKCGLPKEGGSQEKNYGKVENEIYNNNFNF
ncbi:unnamed protein product [Lactuca saligna]|uniref:Ubiquitin-like protease family profile domain-containing protein n=1 Tax=Lactuca saligna TaxID=75948 RepID=A0AA35Y6N8_LACSI|nr:unnamed protein product [Lactuca saligna]